MSFVYFDVVAIVEIDFGKGKLTKFANAVCLTSKVRTCMLAVSMGFCLKWPFFNRRVCLQKYFTCIRRCSTPRGHLICSYLRLYYYFGGICEESFLVFVRYCRVCSRERRTLECPGANFEPHAGSFHGSADFDSKLSLYHAHGRHER